MYKVLIVENNPTITRLLSHYFATEGWDVRCAADGLAAMIMLDAFIPDILFTDIIMPKISGDQLCRIIRQSPQLQDIYIVIYSSTTLEENRSLFDLQADLYIAKGPEVTVKQHIRHVIDRFKNGDRRQNAILGGDGLFPRTITKELLLSRRHDRIIFENLAEAVIEMDSSGRIIRANTAAQTLLARDLTDLLASRLADYLSGPECPIIRQWFERLPDDAAPFCSSYDRPLQIGDKRVLLQLVRVAEEKEIFIIAILQDVTAIKKTEETLAETLGEFNAVMEAIGYGVLFMDANLQCRIVNKAFRRMWGLPDDLFLGNPTFRDLINFNRHKGVYNIPEEDFDAFIGRREAEVRKGGSGIEEFNRKNGVVYQYQCVVLPDNGRMLTYFDITRHKNTETALANALEEVSRLANRDALTGLPNLRLFQERLMSTLSMSKRKGWKAAVMFIDLDGFKNVNDSLGHEAGDTVLKMVAQRLLKTVRKADTVARIGGDEFLIIQTEVSDKSAAAYVANKIVQQLALPFDLEGNEIKIGASIGIAMYPAHGDNSRDLIYKADNAMYQTKTLGKRGYTFAPD